MTRINDSTKSEMTRIHDSTKSGITRINDSTKSGSILLEDYLDKYEMEQTPLSSSIYSMYKEFNYTDEDLYTLDLEFMLNNIYSIKIVEKLSRKKRMNQKEFREKLLEQFNNKCIVTGNDCTDELEACHIVPVSTEEDYSLENGLLLARTIHATFDKYMWSINPDTFMIEGSYKGTVKKYIGTMLPLYDDMKEYLRCHYNIYTSKN